MAMAPVAGLMMMMMIKAYGNTYWSRWFLSTVFRVFKQPGNVPSGYMHFDLIMCEYLFIEKLLYT